MPTADFNQPKVNVNVQGGSATVSIEPQASVTQNVSLPHVTAQIQNDSVTASTGLPVTVNVLEGGSLPLGGVAGDIIVKRSAANFDAEWVAPAASVERDNTRPITSAAVYTEIGNINALLATI